MLRIRIEDVEHSVAVDCEGLPAQLHVIADALEVDVIANEVGAKL
jgi:hypothetical protein